MKNITLSLLSLACCYLLNGQSAMTKVNITSPPVAEQHGLAIDGLGTPYIGSYSNVTKVTGTTLESIATGTFVANSITIDPATNHIYQSYGSGTVKCRFYDGSTWTNLPDVPLTNQFNQQIKVSENDVYVLTTAQSGRALSVLKYNGTTWSTIGLAGEASGGTVGYSPVMEVDENGEVYVYNNANNTSKVFHFNGNSWNEITLPDLGVIYYGGIALNQETSELYIGLIQNDACWMLKYNGTSIDTVSGAAFGTNFSVANVHYDYHTNSPILSVKKSGGTYGIQFYSFNGTTWEARTSQTADYLDEIFFASAYDPYNEKFFTSFHEGGPTHFYHEAFCSADTSVSKNGDTFTANETADGYQWGKITTTFEPIQGETSQSFTPTSGGDYAAKLTINNCVIVTGTRQSDVVTGSNETYSNKFNIYPNPATNVLYLSNDLPWKLFSGTGEVLNSGQNQNIDISSLNPGIYFIKQGNQTVRFNKI